MKESGSTKRPTAKTKERHRTLPTVKAPIPGYPEKLFIYQLPASKYWWVRYYIGGKTVRKTTKTESKQKAIAFAKQFYDDVTHRHKYGVAINAPSNFEACAKELLKAEEAKYQRGELTKITYDNTNYRMSKLVLPFFREYEVGSVDYYTLEKYLASLSTHTPALSLSTISAYMGLVRKVLVYAARRGFIKSLPEFPHVGVKDTPRGWFNTREYRKLWSAAQRYVGKTIEVRKYKKTNGETATQYIDSTVPAKKKKGELMRNVEMTEDLEVVEELAERVRRKSIVTAFLAVKQLRIRLCGENGVRVNL